MSNKKLKIAFLAPERQWWPYYVYKEIVEWLKERYWEELKIYFFNKKINWIKLHFLKFDFIFSVIPFLFKPLLTWKYIYNPRWNFELEKKKNNLWNKLLYFSNYNLKFADNIWIVSYFLADKLNFRDKYNDKILIIPNFVDINEYNIWEKIYNDSKYKILTITSFKFFDKWRGVLNLWKVISKLWEKTFKDIEWTIIWNDNSDNFLKIKQEFDKLNFNYNITIKWLWWCSKDIIKQELKNNDYFLYWTYLDNFPNILLEALASKMKVLVNDFESFKYFLDESIICEKEWNMLMRILNNNKEININIFENDKEIIIKNIYKYLKS